MGQRYEIGRKKSLEKENDKSLIKCEVQPLFSASLTSDSALQPSAPQEPAAKLSN
jgi:hypothetical protein